MLYRGHDVHAGHGRRLADDLALTVVKPAVGAGLGSGRALEPSPTGASWAPDRPVALSADDAVRALVVMGVSGSGKTSVGRRIAQVLGWDFLDADAFHSPANVAKMAAGEPLTEEDRAPWLAAMRDALARRISAGAGVVLACSALRHSYRDVLRSAGAGVAFLYLRCEEALARSRVAARG